MSQLSQLQFDLQQHLLTGDARIASSIVATAKVSIQSRLNVYRNAYQSRLVEALASNFPCLQAHLGDAFEVIARNYIDMHPSTYRSIRWFGDGFSGFLRDYCDASYDYLAELAEFEWNMTLAFDASDVPPLQLGDMAKLAVGSWGDMTLKMHPTVWRMNFLWNVTAIWEAIMNDSPPIAALKNDEPMAWVLWRQNYMNRFYRLAPDEIFALDGLSKGATFGEICEGLCQWHDENKVGPHAAALLKGWIEAGLIAEIIVKEQYVE